MKTSTPVKKSHRYFYLLLICMIAGNSLFAQDTLYTANIRFVSNDHTLTPQNISVIDSVLKLLSNIPKAYKVTIIGYTDNTGSVATNKALSVERAKAVAAYIAGKKFAATEVLTTGKADKDPVASNEIENGKALNRRVSLKFELSLPKITTLGGFSLPDNSYTVQVNKGGSFHYSSGTYLFVPPAAFMDEKAADVTGTVILKYTEYRDPVDFILRGIPMSIVENNTLFHFNSGGMFEIQAFKNNKPVYLKPDKSITINFVTTQSLPNMNFYNFDSVHQKWNELYKLDTRRGLNCGFFAGKKTCFADDCDALNNIIKIGIRFAAPNGTEKYTLVMLDSFSTLRTALNEKLKNNRERIDTLMKPEIQSYFYKLYPESSSLFSVQKKNAGVGTSSSFTDLLFKYKNKKGSGVTEKIYAGSWLDVSFTRIEAGSKNVFINLVNKDTAVSIGGIEVKSTEKMSSKLKRKFLLNSINGINAAVTAKNERLKNRKQLLQSLKAENAAIDLQIAGLPYPDADSLFCFWDKNAPYMDSTEKTLKYEKWLQFFDQNHASMFKRFDSLRLDPKTPYCAEVAEALRRLEERVSQQRMRMPVGDPSANAQASDIVQSFNIKTLGIYNCDQLQRLEGGIEIDALYSDTKGNVVEPVILYIVDEKINGILRYDGIYPKYSPYHFAYSPESRTTLIAIDSEGNSYIYSSADFEKNKAVIRKSFYRFKLTKLENIFSKEMLKARM